MFYCLFMYSISLHLPQVSENMCITSPLNTGEWQDRKLRSSGSNSQGIRVPESTWGGKRLHCLSNISPRRPPLGVHTSVIFTSAWILTVNNTSRLRCLEKARPLVWTDVNETGCGDVWIEQWILIYIMNNMNKGNMWFQVILHYPFNVWSGRRPCWVQGHIMRIVWSPTMKEEAGTQSGC